MTGSSRQSAPQMDDSVSPFGVDRKVDRSSVAPSLGRDFTASSGRTLEQSLFDLASGGDPERGGEYKPKLKQVRHDTRTKTMYEKSGYYVEKTEYKIVKSYGKDQFLASKDFLGFGDLIALKSGESALILQVTSKDGMGHRIRKMRDLPAARLWLQTGNRIEVIGWHKPGRIWEPLRTAVTLDLLDKYESRKRA